jgi:excisionase family DNA binding protein
MINTTTDTQPDFLTAREAATHLRVTLRTVRQWCRDRRLPYYRIGGAIRFRRCDLQQHLEDRCRVASI